MASSRSPSPTPASVVKRSTFVAKTIGFGRWIFRNILLLVKWLAILVNFVTAGGTAYNFGLPSIDGQRRPIPLGSDEDYWKYLAASYGSFAVYGSIRSVEMENQTRRDCIDAFFKSIFFCVAIAIPLYLGGAPTANIGPCIPVIVSCIGYWVDNSADKNNLPTLLANAAAGLPGIVAKFAGTASPDE